METFVLVVIDFFIPMLIGIIVTIPSLLFVNALIEFVKNSDFRRGVIRVFVILAGCWLVGLFVTIVLSVIIK